MPALDNSSMTAGIKVSQDITYRCIKVFRRQPGADTQGGVAVDPHAGARCVEWRDALRQKSADDAGENVARTRGGQKWAGVRVDYDPQVWCGDDRVRTFEDNDAASHGGGAANGLDAASAMSKFAWE